MRSYPLATARGTAKIREVIAIKSTVLGL